MKSRRAWITRTSTPCAARSTNASRKRVPTSSDQKMYASKFTVFRAEEMAASMAGKIASPFSRSSSRLPDVIDGPGSADGRNVGSLDREAVRQLVDGPLRRARLSDADGERVARRDRDDHDRDEMRRLQSPGAGGFHRLKSIPVFQSAGFLPASLPGKPRRDFMRIRSRSLAPPTFRPRSISRLLKKGVGGVAARATFGCGGRVRDRHPRDFKEARGSQGPGFDSLGRHSRSECLRPKARHDARIHFSAVSHRPAAEPEE